MLYFNRYIHLWTYRRHTFYDHSRCQCELVIVREIIQNYILILVWDSVHCSIYRILRQRQISQCPMSQFGCYSMHGMFDHVPSHLFAITRKCEREGQFELKQMFERTLFVCEWIFFFFFCENISAVLSPKRWYGMMHHFNASISIHLINSVCVGETVYAIRIGDEIAYFKINLFAFFFFFAFMIQMWKSKVYAADRWCN